MTEKELITFYENTKLLPCPFCGGVPGLVETATPFDVFFSITCFGDENGDCSMFPSTGHIETTEEAVTCWNKRK